MKQNILPQLLHRSVDTDYVEHFQALAEVNLEIQKNGPTAARLIRKSILESGAGNYAAGREAAEDALVLEPHNTEARYQEGVANLLLAMVRCGATAGGPSLKATPPETVEQLMAKAVESFGTVLADNPEDREASEDLDFLKNLLESSGDEEGMARALRDVLDS